MDATPTDPPYVVEGQPGPGLATITDRRDGTTRLWSRTLRGGLGRRGAGRACANCGTTLTGNFYKPPPVPRNVERLCVVCVEGDPARADRRARQ